MLRLLLAIALLSLGAIPVVAQPTVRPCVTTGVNTCPPVSASNPLPVTGTVTAGGTQDTNIIQILGAAPSAANPIWVSPATASTPWAVTGSGTAGTAAAGVQTVQGIASMTPVQVSQATAGNLNATVVGTGTFAVQVSGNSFTNITTNADTNVKGSAGTLVGFSINTIGTTSSVKFFNDADGTCSSALVGTFTTLVQGFVEVPATMGIGICVQTAGAVAADITVFWR